VAYAKEFTLSANIHTVAMLTLMNNTVYYYGYLKST